MKKQIILIALVILTCFCNYTNAQVSVRFNIGLQPLWGPTGYDYVDYYYIPDIDAYYDVTNQQYIVFEDGRWIPMRALPPRYGNFDLYRAHKVVINEPTPWVHHDVYRNQYSEYRGRHDQHPIRDSREEKYWANPGHPQHGQWHGEHDNGRGRDGDHGEHGEHGHDEGHR